jgi:hypothetical protein
LLKNGIDRLFMISKDESHLETAKARIQQDLGAGAVERIVWLQAEYVKTCSF